MRAVVLGSAAGGGFPQWNCACALCRLARAGDPRASARTQCSIAVSADDENWIVLNAAPELSAQIARTPALHPKGQGRHSPIAAVVLTGAEIDAIAGLLSLREGHSFALYAGLDVLDVIATNPIFRALPEARVPRRKLILDIETMLTGAEGRSLGLTIKAFVVPGKIPLFAENGEDPGRSDDGTTIGLEIRSENSCMFFVPGCAAMTDALRERLRGADLVLFDGTLWDDNEMVDAGLSTKTGARMGHMSINGPNGTMAAFVGLGVKRRLFIHLNNTNPALLTDAPERRALEAEGWEVAFDGMELLT